MSIIPEKDREILRRKVTGKSLEEADK